MLIFLSVMMVFLLAYGVGMTAIMTNEENKQSTMINLLLKPYLFTTIQEADGLFGFDESGMLCLSLSLRYIR